MRNTPAKLPLEMRSDAELIEELCIALRNVAVWDNNLPDGVRVQQYIVEVCAIHHMLTGHGVDLSSRLSTLSQETSWRMGDLLEECLKYPLIVPYVKEADGIRRLLRCRSCGQAERPANAKLFWFCERCMRHVVKALRERVAWKGVVLFRTYNTECRCSHADSDTVLVMENWVEKIHGVCEICILDEIERRKAKP